MKALTRLIFLAAAALLFSVSTVAVFYSPAASAMQPREFTDSAGTKLLYRIYVPDDVAEGEKLPLLLYLHGAGHRGSDNALHVYFEPGILARVLSSEYKRCILVAPQCPEGARWVDTPWEAGSYSIEDVPESKQLCAVYELILSLIETEPADPDRIYITGLSMGGYGTWDLILRHPGLFAAAVPICGAGDPSKSERISDLPVWFFHGSADEVVPVSGSRDMAIALENIGGKVYTYTEYPGVGHSSWEDAYFEPELLDWLFSQSKSGSSDLSTSSEGAGIKWQYLAAFALLAAGAGAITTLSAAQRKSQK